jgi:serine/threonine-protein kinase Chk1
LHEQGIAHRDIKPENLLIGVDDILKISDFGLATIFKVNGIERILDKRCGTLPYVAPEVMKIGKYHGDRADIWSSGIVLTAMMCGELPWDSATMDVKEFRAWYEDQENEKMESESEPWSRMPKPVLHLVRQMLKVVSRQRATMSVIMSDDWFINPVASADPPHQQTRPVHDLVDWSPRVIASSQPEMIRIPLSPRLLTFDRNVSTQPTRPDAMMLDTQLVTQNSASQSLMQRGVKRMTRFVVDQKVESALKLLNEIGEEARFPITWLSTGSATILTKDKRNAMLVFKVNVIASEKGDTVLMDFRLSKGCGIEFKRSFVKIKKLFAQRVAGGVKSAASWH